MATDKTRRTCYLPYKTDRALEDYAKRNGFVDKNGNIKQAPAIEKILNDYLLEQCDTECYTNDTPNPEVSHQYYTSDTLKEEEPAKKPETLTFKDLENYMQGVVCPINFKTPNLGDRESEEMLEDTKISAEGDVGTSHPEVKDTRTDLEEKSPYPDRGTDKDESGLDSGSNDSERSDQDATDQQKVYTPQELAPEFGKTPRAVNDWAFKANMREDKRFTKNGRTFRVEKITDGKRKRWSLTEITS